MNKLEPSRLEIGRSRARWARTCCAMARGSSNHGRIRWPAGTSPRTEEVAGRVIVLPTGLAVGPEAIGTIGNVLGTFA